MGTPPKKESLSKWKSSSSALPIVAVATVLVVLGTALWLGSNNFCYGCGGNFDPRVDGISFGSNGWVTFHITNPTKLNVTFTTVRAYVDPSNSQPTNSTSFVSISVSANNVVTAAGTLSIAVEVQGVTWQSGAKYSFALITSLGNQYPYYGCLGGC